MERNQETIPVQVSAFEFAWNPELQARRKRIVELSRNDLNSGLVERDATETFSRENWERCAAAGLTGLMAPEEFGGGGADLLSAIYLLEGFGYGCEDNGLVFGLNAQTWACLLPLVTFGSEEQKSRFLPGLCDGSLVACHAHSEPAAGSDAFAIQTVASRTDGGYLLNGKKHYITNAPVADLLLVMTSLEDSPGPGGLSAFLVEQDAPGLRTRRFSKMGLRSAIMGEVELEGVFVPESARLGREGAGMAIFQHAMEWERGFIMSGAVGAMQRLLERSVAFARRRKQFGQPIGKFQSVAHRLVDMKLRYESARSLLYRAALSKHRGKSIHMEAAMAKYQISEHWIANCTDAQQIHGGPGYLVRDGVERELRDALGSRAFSGTAEIQKNIIAGMMGL